MPIKAEIRQYDKLRDIQVDLSRVKRRLGMKDSIQHYVSTAAARRISGLGVTTQVKKPAKPLAKKTLITNSQQMQMLLKQDQILSNIITNLNSNTFTDQSDENLVKLRNVAKRMLGNVKDMQTDLMRAAHTRAQQTMSDTLLKVAKSMKNTLSRRLDAESTLQFADGAIDGQPCHVAYLILNNVKDTLGHVVPKIIIAITETGGNISINPTLSRVIPPGAFNTGLKIEAYGDITAIQKAANKIAIDQLSADSHLSAIVPKPVPISKNDAKFDKLTNVRSVKFDDNDITLVLKNIKTPADAQNVANDAYRVIQDAISSTQPRSRIRILYTVGKAEAGGYKIVFTFTGRNAAGSGATISDQQIEHLDKLFTKDQIKKMMRALDSDGS